MNGPPGGMSQHHHENSDLPHLHRRRPVRNFRHRPGKAGLDRGLRERRRGGQKGRQDRGRRFHGLDKEVFAKPEFKEYAKANLVLIEVDFPQLKKLPKSKQEKHDALAKDYGIKGYPSVVLLDAAGKKIGQLGYMEGGPQAFIAAIEKAKGATPAAQ